MLPIYTALILSLLHLCYYFLRQSRGLPLAELDVTLLYLGHLHSWGIIKVLQRWNELAVWMGLSGKVLILYALCSSGESCHLNHCSSRKGFFSIYLATVWIHFHCFILVITFLSGMVYISLSLSSGQILALQCFVLFIGRKRVAYFQQQPNAVLDKLINHSLWQLSQQHLNDCDKEDILWAYSSQP